MHGKLPEELIAKTRGNRRVLLIGLVLLAILGVLYYVFAPASTTRAPRSRFAADGPVPVLATAAKLADVPIYLDAVGTIRALNTVTVRPQVDGKLLSVNFREGQDVKKGETIARIDPVTYQAQLDMAVGKKAQDEAQLANARVDLDRYEHLAATNSINRQQADTQRALVQQYEALVKSDQASIDNAAATLAYTNIVAPIDGRTGIRQVDEGNIVHASDTTGIVVLTQVKPIAVLFTLPQQQLATVNKAFAKAPLTVEALGSGDNSGVVDSGTLTVIDNQVDQTTGTVKFKAEFPNADLQLWPGQFVNVRLLVDTLKQVVVVPTGAVQRGPNGTFVYVAKDDNTAQMRNVTVTQQDETQSVVTDGLKPPERVITTGFSRLSDGAQITLSTGDGTQPPGRTGRGGRRQRDGGISGGAPQ
jgi:multidrug efflux system membrane fusion protein